MSDSARAPRAFIFDCDGTLVDSMGVWLGVQPRLLASYGVHGLTSEDFAEFESMSVEDECAGYHAKWGVGVSGEEICARLMGMLEGAYAKDVLPRPGAVAFLERAHASGIPMAIATSTPEPLVRAALAHAGIEHLFQNVTTTAMAGASKDNPDVYDLALARLAEGLGLGRVAPGEAWVFEDAGFGLMSAGAAGYRRVGIYDEAGRFTREVVRDRCEIFIDGYDSCPDLLERILGFKG